MTNYLLMLMFKNGFKLNQDLRKLTVKPPSVGANGIRPHWI
ncbi:hypothetical protein [Okeania sp. KiyG1]|nr:hypothetical protein [Okeania sp. KiyG1]